MEKTVTLTFKELDELWGVIADIDYYNGSEHKDDKKTTTEFIRLALKTVEGFLDRVQESEADKKAIEHAY